jgi:hypothetical protein
LHFELVFALLLYFG